MLSPQYEATVATLEAAEVAADAPLEQQRAAFDALADFLPLPAAVRVEPGKLGGVAVEWLRPAGAEPPDVVALWLHGGGYNIGGLASHRAAAAHLAAALRHPVIVADYRLAPEHPYPAALDDARAVWHELLTQGWEAPNIGLVGDSAGGGLAVALLVSERDAGRPLPGAAALLSPWVDLTGEHPPASDVVARDVILSPEQLARWAAAYVGDAAADDPLISPLLADLRGLPPLLIDAGGRDILSGDASRLAARARAADVAVDLRVAEEMIHIWQLFAGAFPEAEEALARVAGWLQARLVG